MNDLLIVFIGLGIMLYIFFILGTSRNAIIKDCFECAKRIADNLIKQGELTYIRDIHKNIIVYGNYFEVSE